MSARQDTPLVAMMCEWLASRSRSCLRPPQRRERFLIVAALPRVDCLLCRAAPPGDEGPLPQLAGIVTRAFRYCHGQSSREPITYVFGGAAKEDIDVSLVSRRIWLKNATGRSRRPVNIQQIVALNGYEVGLGGFEPPTSRSGTGIRPFHWFLPTPRRALK